MTYVSVDYFNRFWTSLRESIEHMQRQLRGLAQQNDMLAHFTAIQQTLSNLASVVNRPTPLPETGNPVPQFRTLFSNLHSAVSGTNTLLSNRPPTRFPVALSDQPLDELYGLLHALHGNSLEWFMHLEALLSSNRQVLNNLPNLDTFRRHDESLTVSANRLTNMLQRLLNSSASHETALQPLLTELQSLRQEMLQGSPAQVLQALTRALENLHGMPSQATPVNQRDLPDYTPNHPVGPCRTHGTLVFDNIHTSMPMDIRGSSPSTSLQLRLSIQRTPEETVVDFALYDADALLLSRSARTPHRLASLPGDALALIHVVCPRFMYRLNRAGLC